MPQKTYAIIGTGAIGGYYGALLQRAGHTVRFLLRADYEHVKSHGLRVDSKGGDFTLPRVQAYRQPADIPPSDAVLVCLKTTENHVLPTVLPHVLADDGVVVLLQNGLGMEDDVARTVGPDRVMGGACFICSHKVGPGHVHHMDYGAVTLGDYKDDGTPAGVTERVRSIGADLEAAGVEVRLSGDLPATRWTKLVWNVPFNGLSVVLRQTTDRLMADPDARDLAEALMREVVADARACGVQVKDGVVEKMLDNTAKMTPYHTSMMLDFDRKRPLEVESIFGRPLAAAQQAGAPSPLLQTVYRQLAFLDRVNRSTRPLNGEP